MPPVNTYIDRQEKKLRFEIALPGIDPEDVLRRKAKRPITSTAK
jgi:hypothetical protein